MLVSALTTSATQSELPLIMHIYARSSLFHSRSVPKSTSTHPSFILLLLNFWLARIPWFPRDPGTTFSLPSFAYLRKHPTVYQKKFGSVYSHPPFNTLRAIAYPCTRVGYSPLRTSQSEIQNGAYQYMVSYRIYGQFHCGFVLPIARSLVSCLPIIASQARTLSA